MTLPNQPLRPVHFNEKLEEVLVRNKWSLISFLLSFCVLTVMTFLASPHSDGAFQRATAGVALCGSAQLREPHACFLQRRCCSFSFGKH